MECSSGIGSDDTSIQQEKCYDVVIVGFGPAALAQAIALYEQPSGPKNVLILDKSAAFTWRGRDFPNGRARMRTNLMEDLVTARNPTSEFTFVNYLWATDNLVGYTNLGLINPPRQLFGMYLEWCAKKFETIGWVQYSREVLAIEPQLPEASLTNRFRVRCRDATRQSTDYIFARKVIVAPGMVKHLPSALQVLGSDGRVAHASDLMHVEHAISQSVEPSVNIAIVGSTNDEAFETLEHCMALDKRLTVTLFADGDSVQQSDKNPYAGNALLASNTYAFETLSQRFGHGRNKSSMQSDNLSSLYMRDYGQGIRKRRKSASHFDVVQFAKLVGAEKEPSSGRVSLRFQNVVDHTVSTHGPFDFVFAASGYTRGLHERLLSPLKEYFDGREGGVSVNADYRVNLDRRFVDRQAGIWMIDGFEGGADDAFPFMALRAERILRSMSSVDKSATKSKGNDQKEALPRAAL